MRAEPLSDVARLDAWWPMGLAGERRDRRCSVERIGCRGADARWRVGPPPELPMSRADGEDEADDNSLKATSLDGIDRCRARVRTRFDR